MKGKEARVEERMEMSCCAHPPVGLCGDHGAGSGGRCGEGRGGQAG